MKTRYTDFVSKGDGRRGGVAARRVVGFNVLWPGDLEIDEFCEYGKVFSEGGCMAVPLTKGLGKNIQFVVFIGKRRRYKVMYQQRGVLQEKGIGQADDMGM